MTQSLYSVVDPIASTLLKLRMINDFSPLLSFISPAGVPEIFMVALVGTRLQKLHGVWLDISSPICDVLISDSPPCRSNYAMVSFIPPVIRHKRILFRRWYTEKDYDGPKADAWLCGVIIFVFLVGSLPFDDSNLPNMYKAIHRGEFVFPDWVSKPARRIINRLLNPNPETRYGIEELMNTLWFKKSS